MKLVKKLTVKNVLGRKPSAALLGANETFDVMTVYGAATSIERGQSDMGDGTVSPWIRFKGNFAAIRVNDGTEFRSGTMFLPDVAADLLAPIVETLPEGSEAVNFGFLVTMKKADTTIGYEYTAEPLTKPAEHDPLDVIRGQLAGAPGLAALEAPKTDEKAPETASKAPTKKGAAAKK